LGFQRREKLVDVLDAQAVEMDDFPVATSVVGDT
jgi:hypothetical protein